MIDFEVGDIVFWCSIDGRKPFPVNVYKKNGEWKHQAHTKTNDEERIALEGFVRERLHEMYDMWKPQMKQRLQWNRQKDENINARLYHNDGREAAS